jgi:hypothetical protein
MGCSLVVVRGSPDDARPALVVWVASGVFSSWTRISTLAWQSATANPASGRGLGEWAGRVANCLSECMLLRFINQYLASFQ